ncbi:MAG: PIN domain-containing protein [Chloroflexi bacterium]|nr:PIN domain-containing protein [Chloroflexota bacterium]
MRRYFVDTSFWIALFDRSDPAHDQATTFWQGLATKPLRLITSDYVLDEAYTFLRRHVGLQAAVDLHDAIQASRLIEVAEVRAPIRAAAWDTLVKYDDKVLSFTDCTSFALMWQMGLTEVLTLDADFAQVGFVQVP